MQPLDVIKAAGKGDMEIAKEALMRLESCIECHMLINNCRTHRDQRRAVTE